MEELEEHGFVFATDRNNYFDTIAIDVKASGLSSSDNILSEFHKHGINLRKIDDNHVSVSFDEVKTIFDLNELLSIFASIKKDKLPFDNSTEDASFSKYENRTYTHVGDNLKRTDKPLSHDLFGQKYSETNMMRYIQRLSDRDVGLTHSMIPLGSCTMKLNSAIAMIPITWSGFANVHPFVP